MVNPEASHPDTQAMVIARAQVMAMNTANLEAVPLFSKYCGALMKGLLENGFSREEAMSIIRATTGWRG
jgi:hypothetical protein